MMSKIVARETAMIRGVGRRMARRTINSASGPWHVMRRVSAALPEGGLLPVSAWRQRHRGILVLLWLHVIGFLAFVMADRDGLNLHSASEVAAICGLTALATWERPGRSARTALASLGLIASSALLVHLSGGLIEMHFHFFAALAVIALYEDWMPFLLALGYVVLDHGIMGALQPSLIYNHPDAVANPWKWAFIHAGFVLAASTASIIHWRLSETERVRATSEQGERVRAQVARAAAEAEMASRRRIEGELEHQTLHDHLTGLPNRVLLQSRLQQALQVAQSDDTSMALLMLDLDRFKEVNDTYGHRYGDQLLQQIGPRLLPALRDSDTLARLGGDEFAILLPGTTVGGAQIVAAKLLSNLEPTFPIDGINLTIGGSIGMASYPEHAAEADGLLRCADVAMYVAKRSGSRYAIYRADQDQHLSDRLLLANDLRRAIEHGELVLHYQPKLACQTGELAGVEALVRWQHPRRGLVPPDEFIPLAEGMGLIRSLGRCVLELALKQSQAWQTAGLVMPVAVNLSMRELLDPHLPEQIERLLVKWGVEPSGLRAEITESCLMVDPDRICETLDRLCELGVKVSIDDFGTGYSSLAYLQQLPVDELKIDRSFVKRMASQHNDLVIVRSTIELAHNLGLQVVAEGVEDADAWAHLIRLGCDQAQGFHLGRPMPAADLLEWSRQCSQARWSLAA